MPINLAKNCSTKIDTKELSRLLKLGFGVAKNWRYRQEHLKFHKNPKGDILYDIREVKEFINKSRVVPDERT